MMLIQWDVTSNMTWMRLRFGNGSIKKRRQCGQKKSRREWIIEKIWRWQMVNDESGGGCQWLLDSRCKMNDNEMNISYAYTSMPSSHMTGKTPADRDTVSRSKAFTPWLQDRNPSSKTKNQRSTFLYTQKLLHTEVFTPRSLYTKELSNTDALIQRSVYTEELLHTEALAHRSVYTEELLHAKDVTQQSFAPRNFYTEELVHTEALTQIGLCTEKSLHIFTHAFAHRHVYTQKSLHRTVFTPKVFLHTEASTHKRFYTQKLIYRGICTHSCGQALRFHTAWRPNAKNRCGITILLVQVQPFRTKWRSKGKKLV